MLKTFLWALLVAFIVFGFLYDTAFFNRLLCKAFGHKTNEKIYTGGEYAEVQPTTTDGIGREHATLYARCPRCNEKHRIGQVHRPHAWFDGKLKVWNKDENSYETRHSDLK